MKRSLIVVSNRGGQEYIDLLEALVPYAREIEVTFIAIRDEAQCRQATAVAQSAGATSWRIVSQLSQAELFQLMRRAQQEGLCSLVCKASPNSIFEAAYFGLPMFLLRTGLPMEEWGADIVVRERLGWVEDTMEALIRHVIAFVERPEGLYDTQARLRAFASAHLDQQVTVANLLRALVEVVSPHQR